MSKKLFTGILDLFLSFSALGQVSLQSAVSVYDDLDWSYFQTGILYDQIPFNHLNDPSYNANIFKLHPDSLIGIGLSASVFEQFYYDMALADQKKVLNLRHGR